MNEEDLHARLEDIDRSIRELISTVNDVTISVDALREEIGDLQRCMPDLDTIVQDMERRERVHAGGRCAVR